MSEAENPLPTTYQEMALIACKQYCANCAKCPPEGAPCDHPMQCNCQFSCDAFAPTATFIALVTTPDAAAELGIDLSNKLQVTLGESPSEKFHAEFEALKEANAALQINNKKLQLKVDYLAMAAAKPRQMPDNRRPSKGWYLEQAERASLGLTYYA
jgi:hypothetical protein